MFRDTQQKAKAIRVLLDQLGLADLWTPDGPTSSACALRSGDLVALSATERVLLLASFALWEDDGEAKVASVIELFDIGPSAALRELVVAAKTSCDAIDTWIRAYAVFPQASGMPSQTMLRQDRAECPTWRPKTHHGG